MLKYREYKELDKADNRVEFSSGMDRDSADGKMRPDLIKDGPMYLRWVCHLTKGADHYSPRNWLKASGPEERDRFLESCDRHFTVWYYWRRYGINLEDPENPTKSPLTEDHAAAVFFNINGVEYVNDRMARDEALALYADETPAHKTVGNVA